MPFDVNVETVPAEYEVQIIQLQCDTDLRNTFGRVRLPDFYTIYLLADKFPVYSDHGRRMTIPFGNT